MAHEALNLAHSLEMRYEDFQQPPFADNIHVFKNFANINRKTTVLESLFDTIAGFQVCNFIKKRFLHMCFPVNIVKSFENTFFTEYLWITASRFRSCFNPLTSSVH